MMSNLSESVKSEMHRGKNVVGEVAVGIESEFKTFVNDIENLVSDSASMTGDELSQAKKKIEQRINTAKKLITRGSNTMLEKASKNVALTNEYVHEKPWPIIGASIIASFALGVLIGLNNGSHKK